MSVNTWWKKAEGETYWLELTDRESLGTDLRAPVCDDSGKPNWHYMLFQYAEVGDAVFHYHKNFGGIVAVSIVAEKPYEHSIVWGARSTSARERETEPRLRPGYRVPLRGFTRIENTVFARDIEAVKPKLKQITSALVQEHGAIYFPFELSDKRPSRPLQGYAFKLPSAFIALFPALLDALSRGPTSDPELYEQRARNLAAEWQASRKPPRPVGRRSPKKRPGTSSYQYERDPSVKAWVLTQAKGRCEHCGKVSFYDTHGTPFLELHHVQWLSKGGQDTIENAVGLCPNCHRACHHARNRDRLAQSLYKKVKRLKKRT